MYIQYIFLRANILKMVTIGRLHRIKELPLPTAIIRYLQGYKVPDDFNTDEHFLKYNFNFPNHPHHTTHSVHPARCTFDNSMVLIAVQNQPGALCDQCNVLGKELFPELEKWVQVNHPGLQRCFVNMTDMNTKAKCFVLEYPLISFKDLIVRLNETQVYLPEYILWNFILQICSVVKYLNDQGMTSDLYQPCNFIITKEGDIKVENLLLYLPPKGRVCIRPVNCARMTAIYFSPEQAGVSNSTNVWNLACVFYELAALAPAYSFPDVYRRRVPYGNNYWWPPPARLPEQYSSDLKTLIMQCFSVPYKRPTFQYVIDTASKKLNELESSYKGPKNILQLIPDILDI